MNSSQTCTRCGIEKSFDEYGSYEDPRSLKWRHRRTCNECRRVAHAKRYAADPSLRVRMKAGSRNSRLIREYGITPDALDLLTRQQGGVCAVCKLEKKPLCVDHDHTTGRVRGLLCKTCNFGVGYFHDDPKKLRAAALYLESRTGEIEAAAFCGWLKDYLADDTPDGVSSAEIRGRLADVLEVIQ